MNSQQLPLVSIVIPTYNRADFLGETLDSVISQTYQNWECIVIDDGSTDNTDIVMSEYCKKDTRIQYHHRSKNHLPGGNGARNYGFEISKGKYIQWFDSDDLMTENLIEIQLKTLTENNKKISIGLLDRYNADFSSLYKSLKNHSIIFSVYYDFILRIFKAHLPTVFFEKNLLIPYSLNEKLKKSQEVEFLQRIFRNHENQTIFHNNVIAKIRRHSNSITGNYSKEILSDKMKVKKILFDELPDRTSPKVKSMVKYTYLEALKVVLFKKYTFIYFKYLFSVNLNPILLFKLTFVYFYFSIFNRGGDYYNKIILEVLQSKNDIDCLK